LDNLAIYPTNAEQLTIGTGEMLALRQQLITEDRGLGIEQIQITSIGTVVQIPDELLLP
jgi:hypothetical protein